MFAFANWHSICPAWRSMFSFSLFFAKRHFTRHTWQSMFSFSLFLQNGTSPGILDKDDKVCSLLACFFMLNFLPSQAFPTPLLGTMRNTRTPFDVPHSWEPWETPQPLFMLHFLHSETLPTPLLGTIKHPNPFSCFILAFPSPSHPTLGNHEARNPVFMLHSWPSQTLPTPRLGTMKHPNPFSCFILRLPKPFPPHSWEPWTSVWCFRLFPPHPLFHVSLKGVGSSAAAIAFVDQRNLQQQKFPSFPPHSWEPWAHHTLRNHFAPSQTLPTPLLGAMKHPNQFSCFIFGLPGPFPPHAWEPWSTQTLFHASFFAFPSFSHPTLGNHEKRQNPFSCFIVSFPKPFPPHSWEPWETPKPPSHPTLGSHEAPKPLFMLHFSVSKPFPPHSWEPWSTQPCFHASFLAFSDPSHPTLGNHEAPKPFFMLHFAPSQALPTPLLGTVNLCLMLQTLRTPLLGTMRNTHPPFHVSFSAFRNPSHSWEPWETPKPLFMLHF